MPGSWGPVCARCWPPSVDAPSGARSSASGPDLAGAGAAGSGCNRTGTSGGKRRRCRGRRRALFGELGVQRWRRHPVGRLGRADDHPVPGRVLDQVRGVPRRDHALLAGRLRQRRCGFRLAHIAFQRLLLLLQQPGLLAGVAQLVGALGGVGGQPQRKTQPDAERTDDQHDKRNLARQCAGPQVDRGQPGGQTFAQARTNDLGRLGFPRLGPGLGLTRALGPRRPLDRPGDGAGLRSRLGRAALAGGRRGTPGPGSARRAGIGRDARSAGRNRRVRRGDSASPALPSCVALSGCLLDPLHSP